MTRPSAAAADTRVSIAAIPVPAMARAVFVLVMLVQLPLARDPGYFSHDEFQWAAYAAQRGSFD